MIEVNYNDYKRILEENMRLIPENHKLKEEIERLEKRSKEIYEGFMVTTQELCETTKENERLHSIIKEVREKLLCYGETFDLKVHQQMQKELLEILDKENK